MVTSKFMRSSFPFGNDMLHVFGRLSSLMSANNNTNKQNKTKKTTSLHYTTYKVRISNKNIFNLC